MLTINLTPRGPALQQFFAPAHWRTLRPIALSLQPHYLLDDTHLHPAHALLTHAIYHDFDPDTALPDPVPLPDAITHLSTDARRLLTHHCAGAPAYDASAGLAPTAPAVLSELFHAGITLLPAHALASIINTLRADRLATLPATIPPPDSPDPAAPTAFIDTPPMQITKASPAELAVVRRRVTSERIRWPWPDMEVGDRVVIPRSKASRAQRAVHAYGSAVGKKFRTYTHAVSGELIVFRV